MGNSSQPTHQPPSVHATVWDQLNGWLDNIALAFGDHSLPLREWLPILEAGLGKLTVGVIPPALDQVLVGAIDRSRNPDLKLAILPGLNESVFPAVVAANRLLTESDREELEGCGLVLGQESRRLLARERFLGYIACTRARERLVLSWSRRDARDRTLNRSPFVSQLQVLLPALAVEEFAPPADFAQVEHACELPGVPGHPFSPSPPTAVGGEGRREEEQLPPTQVEQLYGATLKTSVSRIEKFAACPFKFFVESGLRAEERKRFEVNTREIGDFQHEVLRLFHQQLHDQGKRWRDLAPAEARVRVAKIASELAAFFREGLFKSDAQARFTAQALGQSLGQFVATAVEWMATYAFDPVAVELAFDPKLEALPAWEMDLGEGHRLLFRGRIDRIDLCSIPGADAALAVVIDYKSGARKLDPLLLENGLQMQLPAYLAVLRQFPEPRAQFGVGRLVPAGVFYVNLRGQYQDGATRDEVLPQLDAARRRAYRHLGRFDLSRLASLDHRGASEGEQFSFKLTKEGKLDKRSTDPMSPEAFTAFLDQVEEHLRRMGREIFAGVIRPDPYQKGAERACDNCDFKAICRIDPWTHSFRQLRIGSGEVRIKN